MFEAAYTCITTFQDTVFYLRYLHIFPCMQICEVNSEVMSSYQEAIRKLYKINKIIDLSEINKKYPQ